MKKNLAVLILLTLSCPALAQEAPLYEVDASWPLDLPDSQVLGQVSGIAVAPDDTVWVLHRPRTLSSDDLNGAIQPPASLCCRPAPAVLQFSPEGALLQAWGGPVWDPTDRRWRDPGSDWPVNEHGIFVDDDGYVWIGDNQDAGGNHIVVKYTADGRHLLTIGRKGETGGSNDQSRLGRPADIAVDSAAREVYIADGYLNRRVVVFDSETGAYKRHWGAYGNTPDDGPLPAWGGEDSTLPDQFMGPVHAVVLGPDDLVYVADRTANRIQVFSKDGRFVREGQVAPATLANGAVWDLVISPLQNYRWLFVADGANRRIWRLEREGFQISGSFGQGGRQAGQFDWVHNLAVDSQGNLYTSEVNNGRRIQKFIPLQ